MSDFETCSEHEITCPYCSYEFSDSWEYIPDGYADSEEVECLSCDKKFYMTAEPRVDYSTKGNCGLNGEECEFDDWETPILSRYRNKWFQTSSCKNCAEMRFRDTDEHGTPTNQGGEGE